MQRSFACLLEQSRSRSSGLALSASYLEIYNEQVSACLATHPGTPCPHSPGASPPPYSPGPGPAEARATVCPAPAVEQKLRLLRGEPAQCGLREPGSHHRPALARCCTTSARLGHVLRVSDLGRGTQHPQTIPGADGAPMAANRGSSCHSAQAGSCLAGGGQWVLRWGIGCHVPLQLSIPPQP